MKFRKSDLTVEDFERGRKKSELKQALDEFIAMESDVVVIDPKEMGIQVQNLVVLLYAMPLNGMGIQVLKRPLLIP